MSAFPCGADGEGLGLFAYFVTLGPALSPATNGRVLGEWRASFFSPCLHRADDGAGSASLLSFPLDQLTCAPAHRGSPG